MSRLRLTGGAAACLASLTLGAGLAYAAFVATTSNSANSFQAAACFSTQRVASGSYTGDAADNRAITIGFQPDVVIVKADTAQIAIARSSSMTGDASKPLTGATALFADRIQSFTATGFTIGTNAQINGSGTAYRWMALRAGCGTLKVGSYTGNGAASRPITGANFRPEHVMLMSAGASISMQRFAGMTTSFRFDAGTGLANAVNSLDADGFTVGNAAEANTNGTVYHYVATNEVVGSVKKGSYTGNNTDNRNLTGVGFGPDYLMIRANDTATARQGHHRAGSLTGGNSQFWPATANSANGIQLLQADGFQVGTDASVNANGTTYHYLAFDNGAGGCALPSSTTLAASADSWNDQSAPTTNKGTDSVLKVTTKSPSLNTRAILLFTLPAVPSGCSVTGATLRLYNTSSVLGRTIQALRNSVPSGPPSWTENGVTWNNAPATTGTAATAISPAAAAYMQWDVTSQVSAMYPAATNNNGFTVRDQTENGVGIEQQFRSKEAASNPPELIVTIG